MYLRVCSTPYWGYFNMLFKKKLNNIMTYKQVRIPFKYNLKYAVKISENASQVTINRKTTTFYQVGTHTCL